MMTLERDKVPAATAVGTLETVTVSNGFTILILEDYPASAGSFQSCASHQYTHPGRIVNATGSG